MLGRTGVKLNALPSFFIWPGHKKNIPLPLNTLSGQNIHKIAKKNVVAHSDKLHVDMNDL